MLLVILLAAALLVAADVLYVEYENSCRANARARARCLRYMAQTVQGFTGHNRARSFRRFDAWHDRLKALDAVEDAAFGRDIQRLLKK